MRRKLLISGVLSAVFLVLLLISPMQSAAFMLMIYPPVTPQTAGSVIYMPLHVIVPPYEALPVGSAEVRITGPDYSLSCKLPLKDGETVKCGDSRIEAVFRGPISYGAPPAGLGYWYSYEKQKVIVGWGYGYAGYTYPIYGEETRIVAHEVSTGFYPAAERAGFLQWILYWSSPSKPGTYTVYLIITVNGNTFVKTATVTLS
ncbi:MAG: hypothetical protein ACP5KE_09525 [Candidatus Methanodesulfokora sp.]